MAPSLPFHHGTELIANEGIGYGLELYDAGLVIQSTFFGFCLATTGLCLYYMARRWVGSRSDWITMSFIVLLLAYNIVVFGINIAGAVERFHYILGFFQNPPASATIVYQKASLGFQIAFVPTFLWISDAFLLWRASIVWTDKKWVLIPPFLVYLASIVTGIVWSVQGSLTVVNKVIEGKPGTHLADAVVDWIPSLAFSCGMDCITTLLIAGRLSYHHIQQIRMSSSARYLSVVAIFIESAMLSSISKFLQLFVPGVKIFSYAVVPLCTIASSLILLRKALGADVGSIAGLIDRERESANTSSAFGMRPGMHKRGQSSLSAGSTIFGSYHGHKHTASDVSNMTKSIPEAFEEDLRMAVGITQTIVEHEDSIRDKVPTPESPNLDEKAGE